MMHTAIALALFPLVSGFLAFIVAAIVAAYRVAAVESAPFVPEYTANETAEWAADLSLSLDVDAEWIALADTCEECGCTHAECAAEVCGWIGDFSPVPALTLATRNVIASVRADRAAVDAWIAARPAPEAAGLAPEVCEAIATIVRTSRAAYAARVGIAAAAARIMRKVRHTAEGTTADCAAHASDAKLISFRDTFLSSVRFGVAAATARRTLQASLTIASNREWSEAYAEASPAYVENLGTLALLAHYQGDAAESAAAWHAEREAYFAALRESFGSPVSPLVTVDAAA